MAMACACFAATRARGTAPERHRVPDGHGGKVPQTTTGLHDAAWQFLRLSLRGCSALSHLAADVAGAMRPASSASIVGLLLIQVREGPGVPLAVEQFDPEAQLWHDLEGPAAQRLVFDVVSCRPLAGMVEAIPMQDASQAKRPAFRVSTDTAGKCMEQVGSIIRDWQRDGFDVAMPTVAFTFAPAVAALLSHGGLRCFEMSVFRKLGAQVDLPPAFIRERSKRFNHLSTLKQSVQEMPSMEPKAFVSLALTLQGWLAHLCRGAPSDAERQELIVECNMWSSWLVAMASKLSPLRMLEHRVEKSKTGAVQVGRGEQSVKGHRYTSLFVVQAMILSSHLRNSDDFEAVVAQAVRVAFPRDLAEDFLKLLRNSPVPDTSTLSRWRFRVDASFLLAQRSRFAWLLKQAGLAIYILCDASPQAGREWFMTELHVVSAATMDHDLGRLFSQAVEYQANIMSMWKSAEHFYTLPVGDRERAQEDLRQRRVSLATCLELLVAPPVGLGHRRANMLHKLHALTHQLYLLFGESLVAATKQLVAFCTDFGVESSLPKTSSIPLALLCPYVALLDLEDEGGLPGRAAEDEREDATVQYNRALQIPGAMHIVHNMTADVLDSLEHFQSVKGAMKILSRGLANTYLREGLIATSFDDGLAKFHAWKFRSFGDKLVDWRWGSVIQFCQKIELLEDPLAQYFDPAKYADRSSARQRDDPESNDTVNILSFAAAVQNKFLWAYARMLRRLLAVVARLAAWCEWCPCHTLLDDVPEDMRGAMPDPLQGERCPFAGRRGPEMAAGGLHRFLEAARAQNAASLLLELQVPEQQKHSIMNDYNAGVQHFLFIATMKFSFFSEIPYKLMSLAHWDEATARAGAHECLRQWEKYQRLARECHRTGHRQRPAHFLSQQMLGEGGKLRGEVVLFASGVPRGDARLKGLRQQLCKFLFTPVVERGIEGRHSVLKRVLARCPHYSGALASLNMRIGDLKRMLQTDPSFLQSLCNHAETCRDPYYLMDALGFLQHPSFPASAQPGGPGRASILPLCCKIVYRQDIQTQFSSLSALAQHLSDGSTDDRLAQEAFADSVDHEDAPRLVDAVGLMRSYGLAHFRATVSKSDFIAALRKDVPEVADAKRVLSGLLTMSSFLLGEASTQVTGLVALVDDDGDEMRFESEHTVRCVAAAVESQVITEVFQATGIALFFRVEHFQPSSLKLARGDLSDKFSRSNITISTFAGVPDPEAKSVYVEPLHLGANDFSLLVLNEGFFTAEQFKLYKMECSDKLTYSMPSVAQGRSRSARMAIDLLLAANAVPGSSSPPMVVPGDHPHCLAVLRSLRLMQQAQCVETSGGGEGDSGWRLTTSGAACLVAGYVLSNPTPVLAPRASIPLMEWSHYELMLWLHTHKWKAEPWEKGQRRPDPLLLPERASDAVGPPSLDDAQRRWYFRPFEPNISSSYLRAMVCADASCSALCAAGLKLLPHAAPDRFFDGVVSVAHGTMQASDLYTFADGMVFETEGQPRPLRRQRRRVELACELPAPEAERPLEQPMEDSLAALLPPPPRPVEGGDVGDGAVAEASGPSGRRARHEKSDWWGSFNIIYRPPATSRQGKRISPGWEASCPARSHNVAGKCRKTMLFKENTSGAETVTLWRIRHWCNMACFADTKSEHINYHPSAEDIPDEQTIIDAKLPDDWSGEGCPGEGASTPADVMSATLGDAAAASDSGSSSSSSGSSSSSSNGGGMVAAGGAPQHVQSVAGAAASDCDSSVSASD